MTKKRTVYSKEIEAAWYVLNPFISTFDYVIRYNDDEGQRYMVTANPNSVLAAQISKYRIFKPFPLSKYMLREHFNRNSILFYKSAPHQPLSTGYGRRDSDALSLPFSRDLQIVTKKWQDPEYYVLLVGIDIDCHQGEKHVAEVETLIKQYLPETYWETSTNGGGRHGYLKIKYKKNVFDVHKEIKEFLSKLFKNLNCLKNLRGYEAKIDDPAGLPYQMTLENINPYQSEWTSLFHSSNKHQTFLGRYINAKSQIWKGYIDYLRQDYRIPEKCCQYPANLEKVLDASAIQTTFQDYISLHNVIKPPSSNNKFYKITYQRAFKLPLFNARSKLEYEDAVPQMENIKSLYEMKYYTSSELLKISQDIQEDIKNTDPSCAITISTPESTVDNNKSLSSSSLLFDDFENDYDLEIPLKDEYVASPSPSSTSVKVEILSSIKKDTKRICNNCACTNTLEKRENVKIDNTNTDLLLPRIMNWSEIIIDDEEFDCEQYWQEYQNNKIQKKILTYNDVINYLKSETDTMKKTALFIALFIQKLKRIPTLAEVEKEYVSQKLNRLAIDTTQNRKNRFKGCLNYYAKNFDITKTGFMANWKGEQAFILPWIKTYLPEKLDYRQGKRVKPIAVEEVAYVYQIIKAMTVSPQTSVLACSLSYNHADELFIAAFGKKCGRHKFSAILKYLLQAELIEKTGNYRVGLRGNCYQPRILPECS